MARVDSFIGIGLDGVGRATEKVFTVGVEVGGVGVELLYTSWPKVERASLLATH